MKKSHLGCVVQLIPVLCIIILTASCKKDKVQPNTVQPITIGLVEYGTSGGKRVFIPITKVGTKTVNYLGVFDTGSPGMTIDATDIIPPEMITSNGITVTGDSVNVNGITITNQATVINYGDKTNGTKEYGNLAYATVTVGNEAGSINIKRIPIFLYYKVIDNNGTQLTAHSSDVFGVDPSISFVNSAITSPLRAVNTGSNLISGFKLATLNSVDFTSGSTFVSGLLTVGLTQSDISSSGFIMHPLNYSSAGGYSPNIPSTLTYGNKSIAAQVLFDTGTPHVTVIEDQTASIGNLPAGTVVKVQTNKGFVYQYTTAATTNLSAVQNPSNTNDYRTIFSIDFFIQNEYLTDYTNHQIGLKNN